MDVRLPDGTVIKNVPDGTTKEQIAAKLKANGRNVPAEWMQPTAQQPPENAIMGGIKDLGSVAARDVIKAVTAFPAMAMDAGVGARNMLTGSQYELPSQMIDSSLDEMLPRAKPQGKLAKILDEVPGMLVAPEIGEAKVAKSAKDSLMSLVRPEPRQPKQPLSPTSGQMGLKKANDQGFIITPSEAAKNVKGGAPVGNTVQGLAGASPAERETSEKNIKTAEELIKTKVLGIEPEDSFSPELFKALRYYWGEKYQAVADMGTVFASQTYSDAVRDARKYVEARERDFDAEFPQVHKLLKRLDKQTFTAKGAVEEIKALRDDATKHFKEGGSESLAQAKVERHLQDALVDELTRHANDTGQSQIAFEWKQAQRELARINAVEDATIGDRLSARALRRALENGAPLDGLLRDIAQHALNYPRNFLDIQQIGSRGPLSVWDLTMAMGSIAAHGLTGNPMALAPAVAMAARPAARASLRSRAYQKSLQKINQAKDYSSRQPARAAIAIDDVSSGDDVGSSSARDVPGIQ